MGKLSIEDVDRQKKIGAVIRGLRIGKGYSSYDSFAFEFNIPRMHYWRMECGKTNMTIKSLNDISSIHGLKLHEIMERAKV